MHNGVADALLEEKSSDPFKHVVLLMLENQSFDRILGVFQQKYPELEGIDVNNPRSNLNDKGNPVYQKPITAKQMLSDPIHEAPNVRAQISDHNSGFLRDFIANYPQSSVDDHENLMGYYPLGFLPATHTLADEFLICDHWFSSLPGPTWPNRFFALSGTSSGRVKMPGSVTDPNFVPDILHQKQDTIFDRLDEAKKTYKIYYYDFPISLALTHQLKLSHLLHYHKIDQFFKDAAQGELPEFVFIEPKYLGKDQNDNHPPHNVMKAEKLIADVYNAIRSNQTLWESTLLCVSYDEHGGFYDHVEPPACVPPDDHNEEYTFDRLGVRVPALLISPWLKPGFNNTVFDHTSFLKYLIEKWNLNELGERTRQAASIQAAMTFLAAPREDCIPFIRISNTSLIPTDERVEKWDEYTQNKDSIHAYADYLQRKAHANHFFPALPFAAAAKKSMGRALVQFGMWLEQDAYDYQLNRIEKTCQIVEDMLNPQNARVVEEKNEVKVDEQSSLTLSHHFA